jgi:hypothetical protein
VSSIPLDDTRPLLPRRPRRGSVPSGHPRAADDGGPHTKIAPRTPQGRDGPPPAQHRVLRASSPPPAAPLLIGRRSHAGGSSAPLRSAPRRGASRGWGVRSGSLIWPVSLSHMVPNLFTLPARRMKTPGFRLTQRPGVCSRRYPVGNSTVKTAPPSGRLAARIVPPWASTSLRVMARPRPVPPSARERERSLR